MGASQITSITIIYSTVYIGADQRKHQSFASLALVREIHRWPVNSPHKRPVTRKMFPFDYVIIPRFAIPWRHHEAVIVHNICVPIFLVLWQLIPLNWLFCNWISRYVWILLIYQWNHKTDNSIWRFKHIDEINRIDNIYRCSHFSYGDLNSQCRYM